MPVSAGLATPVTAGAGLAQLVGLYERTERHIQLLIRASVLRENTGSEHYYRMQLLQIQAALIRLHAQAPAAATAAVRSAWAAGAAATARQIGQEFTGVDEHAIRQLASALATPLSRIPQTVGRQSADVFRQVGLRQAAVGIGAGLPSRDIARGVLADLEHQGVTAFIDRAGKRWRMSTYALMVASTTTREAVSAGVLDQMQAAREDLVTISKHLGTCDLCLEFEGRTFSISGESALYPRLTAEATPPIHPRCRHVLTPAGANLDEFMADIDGGASLLDQARRELERKRAAAREAEAQPPEFVTGSPLNAARPAKPFDFARAFKQNDLLHRVTDIGDLEALFEPDKEQALERTAVRLGMTAGGKGAGGLTPTKMTLARKLVQRETDKSLRAQGLPERLRVAVAEQDLRGEAGGVLRVSLTDFPGARHMTVERDKVLADLQTMLPDRYDEQDHLLVRESDLHVLIVRPTATPEQIATLGRPMPDADLGKIIASIDPRTATANDMIRVGRRILDRALARTESQRNEVDRLTGELTDASELNSKAWDAIFAGDAPSAFSEKGQADRAWLEEINAHTGELRKQLDAAQKQLGNDHRVALRDTMEEIRPMGGTFNTRKGAATQAVMDRVQAQGAPYLPSRWIERSNTNGPVGGVKLRSGGRAFFVQGPTGDGAVNLAPTASPSTVLHEISHRMEYTVPELMRLEDEYVRQRRIGTSLHRLQDLHPHHGYKRDEAAWQTNFLNPYSGKVYDRQSYQPDTAEGTDRMIAGPSAGARAGEAFTMGQQGAWYGDDDMLDKDPELAAWTLGLLATL